MAQAETRGLSKDELEKALANNSADDLREMARRLAKSLEGMQEVLEDLETERKTLKDEAAELNSTITLMMQEMQKLNIGGMNTVDPKLLEGPLDFVGRFWEKVKPRDTAYQTSEHVGEIKKPMGGDAPTPNVQQVAREVGQHVVQNAQKIPDKLGPFMARAQGFLRDKQKEIVEAVQANAKARAQPPPAKGERREKRRAGAAAAAASSGYPPEAGSSGDAAASSAPPAAPAEPPAAPAPAANEEASPPAVAEEAASPPAQPEAPAEKPASPEKDAAPTESAASGGAAAAAEDDTASTVLIEAKLKVDDGSVLTLQVRASDRCKEVARRFVQENSLKAWFQDPLTAWLKKVEEDAEKFPVHIEGDLGEIRSQFSKKK